MSPPSPLRHMNLYMFPFSGTRWHDCWFYIWNTQKNNKTSISPLSKCQNELTFHSSSAPPWSTKVPMEPFLTSVIKAHTWLIATTTKICSLQINFHTCSHNMLRWIEDTTPYSRYNNKIFEPILITRLNLGQSLERHPFYGQCSFGRWVVTRFLSR